MLKRNIIYLVGRFGAALIALLSISIYTRLLSPDAYGIYALVMAGVMMGYAASGQWLNFSVTRFLPAYHEREEMLLSNIGAGFLLVGMISVMIAVIAAPFLVKDTWTFWLFVLAVVLFLSYSLAEITLALLNARLEATRFAVYNLARVILSAVVGVTLALLGLNAMAILIGVLAGNLVVVLPNLWTSWRGVGRAGIERQVFWEVLAYGMPAAMTGILSAVLQAGDRFIITYYLGTDMAGLYAAPYDFAMRSLQVLMLVLSMAAGPLIFRAYERQGWEAAQTLLVRHFQIMMAVTFPVVVAFTCFAPAIARLMLGPEFAVAAAMLIPWIILATLLRGFHAFYFTYAFMLTKKPLRQTAILAMCVVINISLAFLLIPVFGLLGAAVATVIACGFILVASYIVGRKLIVLPVPWLDTLKVLACCAAMALVFWPAINEPDLWRVAPFAILGSIVYLAGLYACDLGGLRATVADVAQRLRRKLQRRPASAGAPTGTAE